MQLCENLREMDNFLLIVNYQNQPKKKWKILIDQLPWKRLEGDWRSISERHQNQAASQVSFI